MRRVDIPEMDKLLGKEVKVLDKGFVKLVDYMGDDAAIAESARVSYGKGTKTINQDAGLIKYLMRHKHTSPFEMCEIKFHIKLPIFVARQWIRHRTANVNEISARYSILEDEFYIPKNQDICMQSTTNNQGRGDIIDEEKGNQILKEISDQSKNAYSIYENFLEEGLAREISRTILPQNIYTQFYWKIDLHNLLHFLRLRADKHAQLEIREYAYVMLDMVKKWVPIVYDAFQDYVVNAMTFSSKEILELKNLIDSERLQSFFNEHKESKGEKLEFVRKLEKLYES